MRQKKDESTEDTVSPEEAFSFHFRQTERFEPLRYCKFSLNHIKHPDVYVIRREVCGCEALRVVSALYGFLAYKQRKSFLCLHSS